MGPLRYFLNCLVMAPPLYHLGSQHSFMGNGIYFDIPVYEHFHFTVHRMQGSATSITTRSRSRRVPHPDRSG